MPSKLAASLNVLMQSVTIHCYNALCGCREVSTSRSQLLGGPVHLAVGQPVCESSQCRQCLPARSDAVCWIATKHRAGAGRSAPAGVSSWVALSTSEWASQFVKARNADAGKQLSAKEITQLAQPELLTEFERIMHTAGFPADAQQVQLSCA